MRQNFNKQLAYIDPPGNSDPDVYEGTPQSMADVRTDNYGIGILPGPESGGVSMKRRHSGYTIEIHTDCHGDYNKCTIQLTRPRVSNLLPLFARFGQTEEYLPGIRKLERPHFYTILFSKPENAIFITLRKNARSWAIDEFEEIVAASCRR